MLGTKLSKKVEEVFGTLEYGSPEDIKPIGRIYHSPFFGLNLWLEIGLRAFHNLEKS